MDNSFEMWYAKYVGVQTGTAFGGSCFLFLGPRADELHPEAAEA